MNELAMGAKYVCLFLAVAYSVPVIIGGAINKNRVTDYQSWLWATGVTGFIALQWLR